MAALQLSSSPFLLVLSAFFLLISPSLSLTCSSQNFTNNKLYANCTDLPSLAAYLHWTYNSTKSSLSIAFIAPPAKSDGWISWAINPTGTGMIGAQSLIAFKQSDGSMTVKTYDISSYKSIVQSNLSFGVSDWSAEYSGGLMRIFATLALPANATVVNQVWQVGGSVTNGVPDMHEFQPANLNAKGTLDLVTGAQSNGTTATPGTNNTDAAPASRFSPTTGAPSGDNNRGVSRIGNSNFGFHVLFFLASFLLCF